MRIGKDIFEDVKKAIGCEYISDIPKRQEEVIETIRDMKVKESMKKRKIVITVCCMAALISGACIYTAVQPDTVQAEQWSSVKK